MGMILGHKFVVLEIYESIRNVGSVSEALTYHVLQLR